MPKRPAATAIAADVGEPPARGADRPGREPRRPDRDTDRDRARQRETRRTALRRDLRGRAGTSCSAAGRRSDRAWWSRRRPRPSRSRTSSAARPSESPRRRATTAAPTTNGIATRYSGPSMRAITVAPKSNPVNTATAGRGTPRRERSQRPPRSTAWVGSSEYASRMKCTCTRSVASAASAAERDPGPHEARRERVEAQQPEPAEDGRGEEHEPIAADPAGLAEQCGQQVRELEVENATAPVEDGR